MGGGTFVAPNYGVLIGYYSATKNQNQLIIKYGDVTIYSNTTGDYPGKNGNTYCPVAKGMTYTITLKYYVNLTFYPYTKIK